MTKVKREPVPVEMRTQLARLFGKDSRHARREAMTDAQWRDALRKVLDHLYSYVKANVQTDDVHHLMLCSSLSAARQSLDVHDNFWPGYAEGLTRLVLLLIRDYPDHRDALPEARKRDHFDLRKLRALHYSQDANQKLWSLFAAHRLRVPGFTGDPFVALEEFRMKYGFKASYDDFLAWYRKAYPQNYALVF